MNLLINVFQSLSENNSVFQNECSYSTSSLTRSIWPEQSDILDTIVFIPMHHQVWFYIFSYSIFSLLVQFVEFDSIISKNVSCSLKSFLEWQISISTTLTKNMDKSFSCPFYPFHGTDNPSKKSCALKFLYRPTIPRSDCVKFIKFYQERKSQGRRIHQCWT